MASPVARPPALLHDVLLADHRRLEGLLERLLAAFVANDNRQMSTLWTELERGLLAHMETEEAQLLGRLEGAFPFVAEAILRDHQRIRQQLAELGIAVDLHAIRLETARAFFDDLRAHSDREELLLYRWADDLLDATERAAIVDGLRARLEARGRQPAHEPAANATSFQIRNP